MRLPFRTLFCLFALATAVLPSPCIAGQTATQTTDLAHKKAALQKACSTGALSPDECKTRLAGLNAPADAQISAAPLGRDQTYREPNGRYTLTVPAGWTVDTSQGNLKITRGDAWANFNTEYQTGGPLAVAQSTALKMEQFMTEPKVLNQGNFKTGANYPAGGITLGCTISTRAGPAHRVMLFNAIAAGNDNYVVMTSSADYDTGRPLNSELAQVVESIRF